MAISVASRLKKIEAAAANAGTMLSRLSSLNGARNPQESRIAAIDLRGFYGQAFADADALVQHFISQCERQGRLNKQ